MKGASRKNAAMMNVIIHPSLSSMRIVIGGGGSVGRVFDEESGDVEV